MPRNEGRDKGKGTHRGSRQSISLSPHPSMMLWPYNLLCLPAFIPEAPALLKPISPQLPLPLLPLNPSCPLPLISSCWPELSETPEPYPCLSHGSSPALDVCVHLVLCSCQPFVGQKDLLLCSQKKWLLSPPLSLTSHGPSRKWLILSEPQFPPL